MPIYEFECPKCKVKSTKMQKYSDPAPECLGPACNDEPMVRQISVGGFELKGTGWYKTDFKGK